MSEETTLQTKLIALSNKMKQVFEHSANKITSWGASPSDTQYPSAKLVKDSLDDKADASDLSNYIAKSQTVGLVKNDGTIDQNTYLTQHQSLTNYIQKSQIAGLVKNDGTIDTTSYLTSVDIEDLGGVVTVEKQSSAESGYAATYVIKQGGTQVGAKINIPKDWLLKSGELKTAAAADLSTLGNGFSAGDKYIDFILNTKTNDDTDVHMYINVKDLVEDTTYEADESTLTLSNGVFSIKAAGVDTTQIRDSAVTTAKIADDAVTSAKIADAVIATWLTSSDVEGQIEDAVEYLTSALDSS